MKSSSNNTRVRSLPRRAFQVFMESRQFQIELRPDPELGKHEFHRVPDFFFVSLQPGNNQGGDVFVLRASPRFEIIATNPMGERSNSSVVASEGELFLRTHQALWCIAKSPSIRTAEKESAGTPPPAGNP